jgi:S-adenosylmethionine-dependent methyltransferase
MTDIEALRSRADELEAQGAWLDAAQARESVALAGASFLDRYMHVRAVLYAGQLDVAARLIAELPAEREDLVLTLKADIQERLGNFEAALHLWREAPTKEASEYWCLLGQARALTGLGRTDEAIQVMEAALALPDAEATGKDYLHSLKYPPRAADGSIAHHPALTDAVAKKVRAALLETYFNFDPPPPESDIEDHTRKRFDEIMAWFIPWLSHYRPLKDSTVLEVGCGTGSTSAALALHARRVDGYDIDAISVEAARRRLDIMGLKNAKLHHGAPDLLLEQMQHNHSKDGVDCVVLFAVLEHQLYEERIATLRTVWDLLRPGGHLIVADTPNRLIWHDFHTTWLPFFNLLPDEIAVQYATRSPREDMLRDVRQAQEVSPRAAMKKLARLGRGVSYHEFELAIGELGNLVVGDGFDPEPRRYLGISLETRLLYTYIRAKGLNVPPGFARDTLEIVLQKQGGAASSPRRTIEELDKLVGLLVEPPKKGG